MIDKQQILSGDLQQLSTLFHTHFIPVEADLTHIADEDMRFSLADMIYALSSDALSTQAWNDATAQTLLKQINSTSINIPATLTAELQFSVQLLGALSKSCHLDPQLTQLLLAVRLPLLSCSLRKANFWLTSHPLKQLLDFIYSNALGWQPDFMRHSDAYKALICQILDSAVAINPADEVAYQQLFKSAQNDLSKFTGRFSTLANRLMEAEEGSLKNQKAEHVINTFMLKLLQGKRLPQPIAVFMQDTLLHEIKLLLIREGVVSPTWQRWKKILPLLVASYQVDALDDNAKRFLSRLPDEVCSLYKECHAEDAMIKSFCDQLSFDYALLVAGSPLKNLQDVVLTMPSITNDLAVSTVSTQLLKQVDRFDEGRWFLVKNEDNSVKRLQLALKLMDFDQLLFNNFVGQKAWVKSVSDFAYLLSSKKVRAVYQGSFMQRLLALQVDALMHDFQSVYDEKNTLIDDAKRQQKQEQEQEAKRLAAKKVREEAEAHQLQQDAEAQRQALEKETSDLRRTVRLSLDTLTLGSWIEVKDENGVYFKAKLAVRFNATGRFVFVDHDGVTVIESQRDPLIDQVMQGWIRLLGKDGSFEQRLNNIIKAIQQGGE